VKLTTLQYATIEPDIQASYEYIQSVSVYTCLRCPELNYWRYYVLLYSTYSYNHPPIKTILTW